MFDKLFEFIVNNTRFGFALAFAGTIFLYGNKADWWSITLAPEHTSYIIFATLLGYGMLLARLISVGSLILWNVGEVLWLANKRWRENRNVMGRLDELTPLQLASLYWISQNPNARVFGSLLDDPFRALCNKKYLVATLQTTQPQGFKVNKAVYRKSYKIAEKLPRHLVDQVPAQQAPWIKR
jgi:hypothetical protein